MKWRALVVMAFVAGCGGSDPGRPAVKGPGMDDLKPVARGNRLADETSPYLRQHADNPVDWLPWSAAAFEQAVREDKPVFVSIGYSACHWCHVMEHESFEDETIADILNRHFISIKVDREERPAIDDLYMTAVQMMTGRGGSEARERE